MVAAKTKKPNYVPARPTSYSPESGDIVFVWSQNDGRNIEQRTIGYGCHQRPIISLEKFKSKSKPFNKHKIENRKFVSYYY